MRVLYLEPFEGGSHRAFGEALDRAAEVEWLRFTLPARHWKWRMRGSGLWFAERLVGELDPLPDLLLASSFLPLADLVALRPELSPVPKVLYFHENQWAYPVREERERDGHFGFTQFVSAAAADLCLFNSAFNRDSFLAHAEQVLRRMPDARPRQTLDALRSRCELMPVPLDLPALAADFPAEVPAGEARSAGPLLLWNHRWEFDKDPDTFFSVLEELQAEGVPFRLLVCGQSFGEVPAAFDRGRAVLAERIAHWGAVQERDDYLRLLGQAQVVISTARHEFFGISVLEAVHFGARPLVPDALAYPEHFPTDCLYRNRDDLRDQLRQLCLRWTRGDIDLRSDRREWTTCYQAESVIARLVVRLRALLSPSAR